MRYSQVKSVSQLKANAAELLGELAERRDPILITQNGRAKAVLLDVASYEQRERTLALLKILALGARDIEAGRRRPLREVVEELRGRERTRD